VVSGWGHHGECVARAYNGGLGAEPRAGSRGRARGQGVRGSLGWKHFCHWISNGAGKFSTSSWKQYALLRSTGVSVGGPRVHGAPPNPVIGGTMGFPPPPPPAPPLMLSLHWDCVLKVISYTDHSDCCVTFGCILCCQPPAKTGIFAPGQNHEAALSHAEQFPATAADVQRVGKLDNRSADEAAVQHTLETVPWELSTVSSTLRLYRTLRDAAWRHQLRSAQDRTERHTAASQPFQSTWSQLSNDSYCSEANGNVVATRDR